MPVVEWQITIDTVIVIDEFDYAFARPAGHDQGYRGRDPAIVLLVGMQGSRDKLLQINEYYFDRCNIFYEFTPSPGGYHPVMQGSAQGEVLCRFRRTHRLPHWRKPAQGK